MRAGHTYLTQDRYSGGLDVFDSGKVQWWTGVKLH